MRGKVLGALISIPKPRETRRIFVSLGPCHGGSSMASCAAMHTLEQEQRKETDQEETVEKKRRGVKIKN